MSTPPRPPPWLRAKPFFEPGLDDVLRRNIAAGRLRFTTDTAEAARLARVHFLCVGTPQQPTSGAADLTALRTAVRALVGHLRGHHLVVGKSTVPVGTCAELDDEIAALTRDADVELAWNPEFLREGSPSTTRCIRTASSSAPDSAPAAMPRRRLPRSPRDPDEPTPYLTMDRATAELVKVSANAFLATKISFINAISEMCEATEPTSRRWPMRSVTIRASGAGSSTPDSDLAGLPTQGHPRLRRARRRLGVGSVLGLLRARSMRSTCAAAMP